MAQQISAEETPISRLLRPPYSSRAKTSRPWLSTPRKYRVGFQVGPIGVTPRPSPVLLGSSSGTSLPSTTVVPDTLELNGSTWATWEAYSGAHRQATTISSSRTADAIAPLLRTSWPRAVRQGPAEPCTAGSTASVTG